MTQQLKIGVRVPCYRRWCGPAEAREIAVLAEDAGFDSLWVQDHLVAPLGSPDDIAVEGVDDWMDPRERRDAPTTLFQYYAGDDWWMDPYTMWAFLAGITKRVTLASDIMVVPYRNPVVQAKMLGTLDVLTGGRMLLGTGTGHVRAESDALGVDYDARGRAHDEYLRVIKAILSSEETSFEGELVRFGPLRTLIRSVQQPHLPIYIGGNGRRSIRRAAELGDGWLPSDVPPDGLARGIDALRVACDTIGRADLPQIALSLPSRFRFTSTGSTGSTGTTSSTRSTGSSSSPATTPDEAIELLQAYQRIGVSHVSLGFKMPTAEVYLDQIRTFAEHVLPAFR